MKSPPKISVVIPSYNKAKYIRETLNSIFSQNYPNLEVIIQDGGSTDGTVGIIKEYVEKYPKIFSWTSKKDKGQVDAINKGFKKATGDVLTFINADDVFEKGALTAVGKYFSKHPDTLWLAGKGRIIDKVGKEISKSVSYYKNILLRLNIHSLLLMVNYLTQPAVFLGKKAYKRYGPFRGTRRYVMEYELWLEMGRVRMPAILGVYLASFRLTMGTISTTQFRKILYRDLQIARKYTKNPLILFFHRLNNLGRMGAVGLMRSNKNASQI